MGHHQAQHPVQHRALRPLLAKTCKACGKLARLMGFARSLRILGWVLVMVAPGPWFVAALDSGKEALCRVLKSPALPMTVRVSTTLNSKMTIPLRGRNLVGSCGRELGTSIKLMKMNLWRHAVTLREPGTMVCGGSGFWQGGNVAGKTVTSSANDGPSVY